MKKKWVIVGGVLALILFCYFALLFAKNASITQHRSEASAENMRFEVVTTQADQERGLGGRAEIPDNYGMLFVVAHPARVGIWMKDMLAPIDIVWLTKEGTIMLIDAEVSPATYPHVFYPPQPVSYVLETASGLAARKGWVVGAHIALPQPYGSL